MAAGGVLTWSQTAGTNATADPTINFAEGMAPSAVNDSARALMASVAKYRDDLGAVSVTTGTSTAYALTSSQGFAVVPSAGNVIAFVPHATNGASSTLAVDSGTAYPIYTDTANAVPPGVLIAGSPYVVQFDASHSAWRLFGYYAQPANVPIGAGFDYWGSSAPSSSFAFPAGQPISRATYATLFGIIGTAYGIGDGSTTFNLPDKTERVSVMKASAASRLTATYFGGDSTALGAVGGGESSTLVTANLPAYTPAGTLSIGAPTTTFSGVSFGQVAVGATSGANFTTFAAGSYATVTLSSGGGTFSGTAQGGLSTPLRTVQPTIVCNYVIRVL